MPLVGELASLGAAVSWAIAVCTYRAWGAAINSFTLNLLKNTVALALLAPTLVVLRISLPDDRAVLWQLALSGFIGITLGDSAAFAALRRLGAQVSAIGLCLGPPVATLAGYFILGEKLDTREAIGVLVTMVGVFGAIYHGGRAQRGQGQIAAGVFFVLVCGLCQGFGAVLGRQGLRATDPLAGTFVRLIVADLALLVYLAVGRNLRWRGTFTDRRQIGVLCGAASIGTFLGLILMSVGLKFTKAGVSTAIMATYPIWVIPIAVYFLGEKADRKSIAFTLLAAAGVVILVLN